MGVVGWATKRFNEVQLSQACCLVLFGGYVATAASTRLWHLMAALAPLCTAGVLLSTVNTAQLTKVRGAIWAMGAMTRCPVLCAGAATHCKAPRWL
jgi:hypothetical protein